MNAKEIVSQFSDKKILVIGDLYLDEYMLGEVTGISAEAPVPVFLYDKSVYTPGAAANVASNVAALGADVTVLGVVGGDYSGELLRAELEKRNVNTDGMMVDAGRPTTHKAKVMAKGGQQTYQHTFRIDRESSEEIGEGTEQQMLSFLKDAVPEMDAVILSDYRKGVLAPTIIGRAKRFCEEQRKIITADSRGNLMQYDGITAVTPSVAEAMAFAGYSYSGALEAGRMLKVKLCVNLALVTCAADGMWLFNEGFPTHMPAITQEGVVDVTGAGDTVLAALTVALASGANSMEAATLANYAAGVSVKKLGAATVSPDELLSIMEDTDEDMV